MMRDIYAGDIFYAGLDPAIGREQAGRRPVLVVSSRQFLELVNALALAVPISSVDRGWPNHVQLTGIGRPSFAMPEQMRTISRAPIRLHDRIGRATPTELREVRTWMAMFTDLPLP